MVEAVKDRLSLPFFKGKVDCMDRKLAKDIRRYATIGNLAISVVVTIVIGVGLGLALDYIFDTTYLIIIFSILFMIAAIINFIRGVFRLTK